MKQIFLGLIEYKILLVLLLVLWMLPWKAVALWKAARRNDKRWFIALIILDTLAILEILYIFVFSKKKEEKNLQ